MRIYTTLPIHIYGKDVDIEEIRSAAYSIAKAVASTIGAKCNDDIVNLVDSYEDIKDLPDNPNGRARALSLICQNLVGINLILAFNYDICRCERPVDIDFELDPYWKSIMTYNQLDERAIDIVTDYSRGEIPVITVPISLLNKIMEK